MKKTFLELQEVDSQIGELYKAFPELKESKFGYAYKRYSAKNYEPVVKEFREELELIRLDNAMEDEKTKEVLIDRMNSRGYKYTKEGLKAVMQAEKVLIDNFNKKEITITPYITTSIPEQLSEDLKELLKGIII